MLVSEYIAKWAPVRNEIVNCIARLTFLDLTTLLVPSDWKKNRIWCQKTWLENLASWIKLKVIVSTTLKWPKNLFLRARKVLQ